MPTATITKIDIAHEVGGIPARPHRVISFKVGDKTYFDSDLFTDPDKKKSYSVGEEVEVELVKQFRRWTWKIVH